MSGPAQQLISAWRDVTDTKPMVLPGDRDVLQEHPDCTVLHDSFDAYSKDRLFFKNDGRFHLGLVPIPYLGNIATADVFIMMMNPSLGPRSYVEEVLPEYKTLFFDNLHQRRVRGFPFLSPESMRFGGGEYWMPRLLPLAQALEAKLGSLERALRLLAKHVAVLELIPYRAMALGLPGDAIESLESVRLMRAFVHDHLAPRAARGEVLLIVARQIGRWGLEPAEHVIVYQGGETRGARISPATRGGKAILSFLGAEA